MRRNGSASIKEEDKKEKKSILSRNDIYLMIGLLLIACLSLFWLHFYQKAAAKVVVTIEGEEYASYDISKNQEIYIKGRDFVSHLQIKDGKASMIEADCRDQICVKHTPIYRDGETIVCLPHKLVVRMEDTKDKDNNEIDIITK